MRRKHILIADDHKIVLDGLKRLLETEFDRVDTVGDGRALVQKASKLKPDVVVVDISMPKLNGIEAIRLIKEENKAVCVVVLTMHSEPAYAVRALEAGATGYVLKHSAASELVRAIHDGLWGRIFITPSVDKMIKMSESRYPRPESDLDESLSSRQREVLQLLAEGYSAKEAADELHLSPRTVEFHKYSIMKALRIKTTAELVQFAIKNCIISS